MAVTEAAAQGSASAAPVRVKCAVCHNVDLCLECFAVGVEVWPHKRTHAYKVVENLSFPLLSPDWGADEELLLLDAVSTFGLCNWKDISGHVGNRTAEQCRAHYHEVYISSPARPLPDPSRVLLDKRAKVCAPSATPAVPAKAEPVTPTTERRANGAATSTSDGATAPGSPLTGEVGVKGNGGKSPGGHTPTAGKTPASGPGGGVGRADDRQREHDEQKRPVSSGARGAASASACMIVLGSWSSSIHSDSQSSSPPKACRRNSGPVAVGLRYLGV